MVDRPAKDVRSLLEKWILPSGLELLCDLEKSRGDYLHDAITDIDFLDFFGFYASRPLGYNHPGYSDPAYVERVTLAARHKPSNCDVYTAQYAEFVDLFSRVALGGEFDHVFFIEGGAPAVENAVKAAIDWKVRKNLAAGHGERGKQIIHFKQAFHGRTAYAMSMTDPADSRKVMYYPVFDWPRISNPVMSFPFDDDAKTAVEQAEAKALTEIDEAFSKNPHDIAAIIIEPIQGEGGDNYFRTEFLQKLRTACDERDVMLIFDEIQTGFGTTGAWWDWQNHRVKPDLLVFGKKTQVCGFAANARLDEIDSVFKVHARISSTFEGNLVDMVRCQRIIEIIEEEDLLNSTATMGKYMLKLLNDLAETHPDITQIRGRGGWSAFNMPSTQLRDELIDACFEEELLVIKAGTHAVRFRPALDVGADAVGRSAAQLEAALRRLKKG